MINSKEASKWFLRLVSGSSQFWADEEIGVPTRLLLQGLMAPGERPQTQEMGKNGVPTLFRFDVGLQSFSLLCLGPGSSWPKLGLEILDFCNYHLTVTSFLT